MPNSDLEIREGGGGHLDPFALPASVWFKNKGGEKFHASHGFRMCIEEYLSTDVVLKI